MPVAPSPVAPTVDPMQCYVLWVVLCVMVLWPHLDPRVTVLWCYGLREGWVEAVLRCYGVMGAKQAGEIIQIVQNGQTFLRGATPRPPNK
jgi:hypothetical protein